MGCLFTKVKEPLDGIYLDVHDLKEVPTFSEQPVSSLKKRCKTPQNLDIVPSSASIQDHSYQSPESPPSNNDSPNILGTEMVTLPLVCKNSEMVPKTNLPDEEDDNVNELDAMPRRSRSENFSNGCRAVTKKLSDSRIGDEEKLTRKCSFGIATKIIEFNPKKCINIYRLDSGSIRDEEDDLSYFEVSFEDEQFSAYTEVNANDDSSVYLNESLAFQNANFVDSQPETRSNESSNLSSTFPKTYKIQQTPNIYSTVSHQAYSGAKRAISNRKSPGNIWDGHSQKLGNTTNMAQQQSRITQSTAEGATPSDSYLRQGSYGYSKGRQNSMERNVAPENQFPGSDDQPVIVYHTKRRISTISISSNDKEELNALDGVTHLHPHPGFNSDRRNSTTFDHSVRRLSSNLVGFFHS